MYILNLEENLSTEEIISALENKGYVKQCIFCFGKPESVVIKDNKYSFFNHKVCHYDYEAVTLEELKYVS